ncbi:Plexin A [Caligus rogercresseyi]|uniref:Plexin A n=1 Tax=Caligus rogercresseyi TaxID=217165 RepID=A0A7T8K9N6_CALRO|nr:Plexin A [Caligus rogercresseyi]
MNLDLSRPLRVVTGPQEDTPQCSVLPKCAFATRPTDNVNKALVIDYAESRLISCGSLFQGACTVRSLRNISNVEREVPESVVANNATASTPPISRVLYVGVSFTTFRHCQPKPRQNGCDDGHAHARQLPGSTDLPHYYIYGFSSEEFSYFLTTQMKRTGASPFHSRLVRVCHADKDYYSYTEIPIECISSDNSKNYNLAQAAYVGKPGSDLAANLGIRAQDDVLFVVFSESDSSEGEISSKPSKNSALCVYALKSIRRKFMQNIQRCFSGTGFRGLDFISTSLKCINTRLSQIKEDFCGLDVNTPLGGELPIIAEPVLTFDDAQLTAVTATSTGDFTVAFIGTGEGHLKKVVVASSNSGLEYSSIPIAEDSKVNSDLVFDFKRDHIYVMTEKQVAKVRVQDCSIYETCGECLGAKDLTADGAHSKTNVHYGATVGMQPWTLSTGYPTKRSLHDHHAGPTQRASANHCPDTHTKHRQLALPFRAVPLRFCCLGKDPHYQCDALFQRRTCTTPRNDLLPLIPANEHHFTSLLSVRMAEGPDFVSTNFTFFDCNTFDTCSSCVSSNFPCDWCVDAHRCTHDTAEYCRNDILVTGSSETRVLPTHQQILVSAGISKAIRVKIYNIANFISNTRFVCQFNIEGRVTSVNAQMLGDIIYCDDMEFSYTSRSPNITASFAVIWGGSKPLDNPGNIHVLIYRCKEMADNCGMCLSLDEKFECGWCQSSGKCEVKDKCGKDSWLNREETCPNPMVLDFHPTTGPWEGGTNITITGINLGKQFSDIYGGITVAGIQCDPYEHLYQRTERIVCKVDGPGTKKKRNGPVIVKSAKDYEFIDPQLTAIRPRRGPVSGGTRVKIIGKYMNAGSHIEAFIGDSPCKIIETRPDKAICITSASKSLSKETVKMVFDKGLRDLEGRRKFEYVEDPNVDMAYSGSHVGGAKKVPKGIVSGGINVTVEGSNFNYIQEPLFYVIYQGQRFQSNPCNVVDNKKMFCLSPRVDSLVSKPWRNIDQPEPLDLNFGFTMDDVARVQNLSSVLNSYLLLYPDPEFNKFEEEDGIKYYKSDYLTLNGKNLNRASKESDMKVRIGKKFCNVTSLSSTQLTCKPPESQPEPLTDMPNDLPEVIVMIGDNLEYRIGHLSYSSGAETRLPTSILAGVILGACILLLIVIAILILYRRKSSESTRLRVAAECKEAFTELQTEITELGIELQQGGIPFLNYRTYCVRILFPSWDRPELQRKEKGLRMFGQLIMNKTFLSNRYFSMRDRVNVASLIMVTLQSRMEYCTDILKTLLGDLIEKCIEGKSHPKLLLRRTESVAEKMLSSWFTSVRGTHFTCSTVPLNTKWTKGPQDTHSARKKLIRQQIEYSQVTVYVSMSPQTIYMSGLDPSQGESMDIPVKVLNCDCISQVKDKALDTIYRAFPYSQRPKREDLDLEWRTGTSGRLILYDEDSTTKTEGDWKRINTLNHYRVPEGALLTLVPKQSSMYNISTLSDKSDRHLYHKYETLNLAKSGGHGPSPPISRATSPLNPDYDSNGLKMWHLVRHDWGDEKDGGAHNKMVSEIYLTRLLSTKGTLQKFVDDLFETIFSTAHRGSALPLAIKYMFDFLDEQAHLHNISDVDVVHTWKSNSLPLRFWVNLIKNPDFVFDIGKSNIVDSCLSVTAQTFMDACSTSDHVLGKDSPSSKLLYAKDIPVYKDWVERYYSDIKAMPVISDQDMNAMLAEESRLHANEFNLNSALHELYSYAVKYNEQLILTLDEDKFACKQRLVYKLEQVHNVMQGDP